MRRRFLLVLTLTLEEKRTLLVIARSAIVDALRRHGGLPPAAVAAATATPALCEPHGAFVTLHKPAPDGALELRGCIGYVQAPGPLAETVARAARAAAFHDPRFPAVAADELALLEVEVSVLSRPLPVSDPAEVTAGLHGVIIKRGFASGLLLPQVASEQSWDRETFLDHACLKAGLPSTAWRETGTAIEIFTALVFNETDLGSAGPPGGHPDRL
jgi:AmmeMemoRadiSam system protein A